MRYITLRTARKRAGLTQVELAAASGVEQTVISKLEVGRIADPAFTTGLKLAKALGMDPAYLRFGVNEDRVAS